MQSHPKQPRTGVVSGTVVDPSGSAIAGADVTLAHANGKSYANGKTDGSGSFRIEMVPPGAYVLTIDAKGFQPLQRDLNVTRKPLVPIRLSLAILTEKQFVTVTANQAAPVVSTEASDNQNANTVDRGALDLQDLFFQHGKHGDRNVGAALDKKAQA